MFKAWRTLRDSLPGTCQVCGAWPSDPVCAPCARRFQAFHARCTCCAAQVPQGTAVCGACLTRQAPTALKGCVAAVDYGYPWDTLIARFKFRDEPGWASAFARQMLCAPNADALLAACDLVAPIPLTATRLAERGYNQAWELVKGLQRRGGLPTIVQTLPDALVRLIETPDQHSLNREQRLHNLDGVFGAHPLHAPSLQGKRVLLVDDVTTTGATLRAAAQALSQAGAATVNALVFARTPR